MWLRKNEHLDPLTGDVLTRQERLSITAQSMMRQWKFVLGYVAISVVWWVQPRWFGDTRSYTHWQLAASLGALVIESVVGIGMFGWARRDSLVLRRIQRLEDEADRARLVSDPVNRRLAELLGIKVDDDTSA